MRGADLIYYGFIMADIGTIPYLRRKKKLSQNEKKTSFIHGHEQFEGILKFIYTSYNKLMLVLSKKAI